MYYMKNCVQGGKSFHLLFLFAGDDCEFIEVIYGEGPANGLYVKTDERVPSAPNSSVWKNPHKNEYIFNTGSIKGWRIGKKSHLSTEKFDFKGKNCIFL